MRLTAELVGAIKQETERYFGPGSEVWLFGSRTDDKCRGGDIDLYVQPEIELPELLIAARFAFLARLKRRIGDRKIDVVLHRKGGEELPVYALARRDGVHL